MKDEAGKKALLPSYFFRINLVSDRVLFLQQNFFQLQGSFIIEALTDFVKEVVLVEVDRITERGGVLGAMDTITQHGKIQEDSLYYEILKRTGELPTIGVNTFLNSNGSPIVIPQEVIRSASEEKEYQIMMLRNLQEFQQTKTTQAVEHVQDVSVQNKNIFAELMEASMVCSQGHHTKALFEIRGQYRRNM